MLYVTREIYHTVSNSHEYIWNLSRIWGRRKRARTSTRPKQVRTQTECSKYDINAGFRARSFHNINILLYASLIRFLAQSCKISFRPFWSSSKTNFCFMCVCVLYSQNWWWWFLFISFVDVFALTLVEYIFISRGCAGEREREREREYYYLLFSVYVYKYIYHSFALLFLSVLDCCYSYFGDWLFFLYILYT